jgi:hypothetical protein
MPVDLVCQDSKVVVAALRAADSAGRLLKRARWEASKRAAGRPLKRAT